MQTRPVARRFLSQPVVAALASLLSVLTGIGCSLELSNKQSCQSNADCLSGFACFEQRCRATPAQPGAGGSGPRDWPARGGESALGGAPSSDAGEGGALPSEPPAVLTSLAVSAGALAPAFDPNVHEYALDLPLMVSSLRFTLTGDAAAALSLDGAELGSGSASAAVELAAMGGVYQLGVSCAGQASRYTVNVRRGPSSVRTALVEGIDSSNSAPFGLGVAIDGDTLAVGSIGSVDVYRRSATGWQHEAHLRARASEEADNFGTSLALSGDTLLVGAPFEDSASSAVDGDRNDESAEDSGAAYVFTRTSQRWSERAYLKASRPSRADNFGWSVGIAGDVLAIGAPSADGSGTVSLFFRSGQTWLAQTELKAENPQPSAFFGASLALTEHSLLVGAEGESIEERPGAGAAYVFAESGGVWSPTARLQAREPDANDAFGRSVAFDGQLIAVGVPHDDHELEGSGAVSVFGRDASGWQEHAFLKAQLPRQGEAFGWTVGLSERTLAIGAYAEGRFDGNAYVFAADGNSWLQRMRVNARSVRGDAFKSELSDQFGWSLALGRDTLVVGAPYEGKPGSDPHGTGYLFE